MYQVIHGDCLEGIKDMDKDTFDLILSDPPYYEYQTGHRLDRTDKLSKPIQYQSRDDQIRTMQECIRVLKKDSALFLFSSWENDWWMHQALGNLVRNKIIWVKNNWTAGDLDGSFGNQYEVILLVAKGKWQYTGRRESDVWMMDRVGTNRIHPTEKPVELYKKIIENSTQPGDWILDPYGGSGASVIAALELNRHIITYEIDTEFYNRINNRIKEAGY